ncbi:Serine/threonine-protein kinase endoribonuclease IRE2 [Octopus vulgaris]|uniref:Serine/threonine-protein kinase endoribonuclease IRE2 n=1 Tax=Octopus vulgaris TaxID=6645 RepID=A0AA36EW12_OCTVU|nr:Serine/threonine-protein kinase endoribonuclease IRE2 [Octopus vulgaris]
MVRHKTLKRFTPKANSSKAVHSEQSNRRKIHMDSLECKSKFCQCWKDDKDSKLPNAETITAKLQVNKMKKEVVPKFNNATQNVVALLSSNNPSEVLRELLTSGWDINEKSVIDGATALAEAIAHKRFDVVKCLITNGADISIRDDQGKTLLHLAVEVQWEKCVLLLINNGASVNSCDNEGKIPLMLAASQGHNRIVEQLILAGSNILTADKSLLEKIRSPKECTEAEKIEYYGWILLCLMATAQLVEKDAYIMKVYYKLKVIANVLSSLQMFINKCETIWTHFIEYFNTIAYEKQQETIAQLLGDEIRLNKKKEKKLVKKQLKRKHHPQQSQQAYENPLSEANNDAVTNNTNKGSSDSIFKAVEQEVHDSNLGKLRVDNTSDQSLLSPTELSRKACKKMLLMNSVSKNSHDVFPSPNGNSLDTICEKSVESKKTVSEDLLSKSYNEVEHNTNVNRDCYSIDEDLGAQWTTVVAKKSTCKYENRTKHGMKTEVKIPEKIDNNSRKSSSYPITKHYVNEGAVKVDSTLGSNFRTQNNKTALNATSENRNIPVESDKITPRKNFLCPTYSTNIPQDLNKQKIQATQVPSSSESPEKYKAKPVSGRRNSINSTPSPYPYFSKKNKSNLVTKQNVNCTYSSVFDSQHKTGKISLEELLIAKIESYCKSEDNLVDNNYASLETKPETSVENTHITNPSKESNVGLPFFMPSIHFESEKDWKPARINKKSLQTDVQKDRPEVMKVVTPRQVLPNKTLKKSDALETQVFLDKKHAQVIHNAPAVDNKPDVNRTDVNFKPDVNTTPDVNFEPNVNVTPDIITTLVDVRPVAITTLVDVTPVAITTLVDVTPVAITTHVDVTLDADTKPDVGITPNVDVPDDDDTAVIDTISDLDVTEDLDDAPDLDVTQELDSAAELDVTPDVESISNYTTTQNIQSIHISRNHEFVNSATKSQDISTNKENYLQMEDDDLDNKEYFKIRQKKEDFTNNSLSKELKLAERAQSVNSHFFQDLLLPVQQKGDEKYEQKNDKVSKSIEKSMERAFSFKTPKQYTESDKEICLKKTETKRYHMARFSKDPVCLNLSSVRSSPAFRDIQLTWMRQYLQQLCQNSITRDLVYNHNAFYYMTYFSQKEKDSLMSDFPEIFSSNVSTGYHISYHLTKTSMKEDNKDNTLKQKLNIPMFLKQPTIFSDIKKSFIPFEKHQKSVRWQKHLNHLLQLSPRNLCYVEDVILPLYIRNYNINVRGNHFVVVGLLSDGTELAVKLYRANECPVVCGALRKLSQSVMVGQKFFLATMNLCECNLKEYIDWKKFSNRFDLNTASYLFWHMVSSLKYLHDNNIVHGRLEPKNILITVYGKLLLSNYGFHSSWIHGPDCQNYSQKCWQPSEFLRSCDGQKFSIKSDIQVAGMVAYFILSGGHHPFGKSSSEIPLNIILHEKQLCNLSLEASDIITMMLSAIPDERPTASEVLKHPYFWSNQRKLQFLLTVGSDILNALMLQSQEVKDILGEPFNYFLKKFPKLFQNGTV